MNTLRFLSDVKIHTCISIQGLRELKSFYFLLRLERISMGGFICTFSFLISLSFTFQSSKFPIAVELEWQFKWLNGISSVVIPLNLKRDRTRIGLSFQVTHHIKTFWTDCELIPELTSSQCNWKGNQKGKGTDETLHYQVGKLDIWNSVRSGRRKKITTSQR